MSKYYLTNKAVEDLTNIWNYTFEEWSEKQADSYYEMLIESCEEIAENPLFGKSFKNVTSDLLGVKANKHIIFYRKIAKDKIVITRILHGRLDLKKRIRD